MVEFLEFFFAYCWLNTYNFLVESDVVLRKVEFLLPLLILILQCQSPPPKMPLTATAIRRTSAFYSHQRLHQFLIMIDAFLLNLLLVVLLKNGEIVMLLPVDDRRLSVEEF